MMATKANSLKFKFFKAKKPQQILLCVHGFAGDKESSVIEAIGLSLQKHNITTVAFDLPCHGEDETSGVLCLEKCQDYLSSAIEQVCESKLPINIFATSFGAYLFLLYYGTSKVQFKNIILRSPAIDMQHIIKTIIKQHNYKLKEINQGVLDLGYGREILVDKHFVNSLSLPKFSSHNSVQINIIQGKNDDLIDCAFNEEYLKKYFPNNIIYYFKNADHRYKNPGEKEKIVEIVQEILLKK